MSKDCVNMEDRVVLISIKPKWCERIVSGEKTIEVRKTVPKLSTPFTCYIYKTKDMMRKYYNIFHENTIGKVIGEFVCDKIFDIVLNNDSYDCGWEDEKDSHYLTSNELSNYLNGKQGYGWHITNLTIYDEPKSINEFHKSCINNIEEVQIISRAPQSWCYCAKQNR